MKRICHLLLFVLIAVLPSCISSEKGSGFTSEELAIINDTSSAIMKIYLVNNHSDSLLLRRECCDLTEEEIASAQYRKLAERMVRTVTDSTVDGVGLAAPQVGISRRIVAVQRFDKEGAPFEVYPNIRILSYSAEKVNGREGCLSVPETTLSDYQKVAGVERSQWVVISYTSPETLNTQRDTVDGYTARIFQHETDHLDGILYTDRIK